ncbi:MAG: DNA primase [Desulfobulbaceae bacterium]|nr:DNA primase [Desulfobulbaceae bacterium]
MANDEGVVQAVKDAADILEVVGEIVSLKKAGVNYKGLCPFHGEKTPSFTVNPARRSFHCFGCGEGGDALSFIMRYQGIGFWEALKQLAGRYHISLPERELSPRERQTASKRKELFAINQQAALCYHQLLFAENGAVARNYLEKRRIPLAVINDFQLGFAPESWDFLLKAMADVGEEGLSEAGLVVQRESGKGYYDRFRNRVLFPIISHSGKYLGFGGRILDNQEPKYLNSPETLVYTKGKTLFGLFQNKEAIRRSHRALIVEGNFDLLSLVAAGVRDVVAPLGTALTSQHIRALKGYAQEAVLLFDGDQAGIKAAMRAVPLFLSEKVAARVVILPDGHDPDTFVTEFGAAALEERLAAAYALPEFVVSHLVDKHGLDLEGKGRIVEELRPLIKAIDDQDLQRSLFVSHFSTKLGLSEEQLLGAVSPPLAVSAYQPVQTSATAAARHLKISYTMIEEQLLSFLIIYPEYVGQFVEEGLLEIITQPSAANIVKALQELHSKFPGCGAERLLDQLEGPERTFVSRQLISVPVLPDTEREAAEKIAWLRENRQKQRMRQLTARINEAQSKNDQELLFSLLLEKKKISERE